MNQKNGSLGNVALVEVVEEDERHDQRYNSSDPTLKSPKEINTEKKGSWKRKLITWGFILLLIGGGVLALYLLFKVNRVSVRVQADSRRDPASAKTKPDSGTSESGLTADAINIARAATGADSVARDNANAPALANASQVPSPSQFDYAGKNLSYTGHLSPLNEPLNDTDSNGDASPQQNGIQERGERSSFSETSPERSHANTTQSIFVGDMPKPEKATQAIEPTQIRARSENSTPLIAAKTSPSVLPPFGTMLPVRTQAVIFTLRNNSYARLELTRDSAGQGWSLPKGTVLVGRTTGNEYDRAFVSVIGYIDPRDNKLIKMAGDVLGSDGAAGIPGKRIGVDHNRFKQTLRKVASTGMQIAGTMAGALAGRGTVVIDGAGYRVLDPITNEARGVLLSDDKKTFVKVEAGQPAYVMVSDLPKGNPAVDAPGEDSLVSAATGSLTDREVMELILFGTPEEIRAAVPLMTEEQKRLTLKSLSQDNDGK